MKAQQKIELSTDLLIDSSIEQKNLVAKTFAGFREVPADIKINAEAMFVFQTLMQCFQRQGNVSEGELANVIWGFAQSGIPEKLTAAGLTQLRQLGYIKYTDQNRVEYSDLDVIINHRKQIWIRYTRKFINLLIDPGQIGANL